MVYANFSANDTILAFSNYIGTGMLDSIGSPEAVGLTVLFLVALFCFLTHLPGDASAFLFALAVLILAFSGFLPMAIFYFALIVMGLLLAWFLFKILRV